MCREKSVHRFLLLIGILQDFIGKPSSSVLTKTEVHQGSKTQVKEQPK